MEKGEGRASSAWLRDMILGGQDGLVNVLGIVLAVAEATELRSMILIAGLAATFAESISMAAVAYTSGKAGKEFYAKRRLELGVMLDEDPKGAKEELTFALGKCGLEGSFLSKAVQSLLRRKDKALDALTNGEEEEFAHPVKDAFIVGMAAIVGSVIPLFPFIFLPVQQAVIVTLGFSTIVLFASGAMKAQWTAISPLKSGAEMAIVGMTAAIAGYLIGKALGATIL